MEVSFKGQRSELPQLRNHCKDVQYWYVYSLNTFLQCFTNCLNHSLKIMLSKYEYTLHFIRYSKDVHNAVVNSEVNNSFTVNERLSLYIFLKFALTSVYGTLRTSKKIRFG